MNALFAPLPRRAVWIFAAAALLLFALAWIAFRYPLTYCDSPGWAPSYLADLIGRPLPHAASPRGWPATFFLGALGAVSTRFYVPNFIGLGQGLLLLAAVVALARVPLERSSRLGLVVLPALLASMLRHAIYAETVMSESLTIALVAALVPAVLEGSASPRRALVDGALVAVLASIRLDLAYFVPLVLVRPWFGAGAGAARRRIVGATAAGLLAATAVVVGVGAVVGKDPFPTGRVVAIAEWAPITGLPANGAAAALRTPLTDSIAAATARGRYRTVMDALPAARALATRPGSGWGAIARLMLYDVLNHPGRVVRHRLAVLHDLFASTYAAFWPDYRPRSAYYSRAGAVFSGWSVAELDDGRYSPCDYMAVAQREYFHATGVANDDACRLLLALHRIVTPYAVWIWRPLAWLALPAFLVLLLRRRVTEVEIWLAVILGAHFLLRALVVCADERYELPVDLLLVGWITLVIPDAIRAFLPAARAGGGAGPAAR